MHETTPQARPSVRSHQGKLPKAVPKNVPDSDGKLFELMRCCTTILIHFLIEQVTLLNDMKSLGYRS
jgi:hypothetical protein